VDQGPGVKITFEFRKYYWKHFKTVPFSNFFDFFLMRRTHNLKFLQFKTFQNFDKSKMILNIFSKMQDSEPKGGSGSKTVVKCWIRNPHGSMYNPVGSETSSRIQIRIRIRKKTFQIWIAPDPKWKWRLLWKTDKIWQFLNRKAQLKNINTKHDPDRVRIQNLLKSRIRIRKKNRSRSTTLHTII